MEKSNNTFSPFLRQCFVTAAVCGNIMGHSSALGFPGILLPQLKEKGSIMTFTIEQESWIAASMSISVVFGNFMTPPIMDRFGRKVAHFIITLPLLFGWFCISMSTSFEVMFVGRIIQGLSFGMFLPLRSTLIGEYTSPANRGAFLSTVSLGISLGIFFVHFVGSFISWQKTALLCALFPFTSLVLIIFCPESPSYLAAKGKYDECRRKFRWLRGDREEAELEAMINARIAERAQKTKQSRCQQIANAISKKEFVKPVILMLHVYSLDKIAGGLTTACYSTVIIKTVLGENSGDPHWWMIALDAQRVIANTVTVYFIKRFRRRTVMFVTGGLCVGSHLAIVFYVYGKLHGMIIYDAIWLPALLLNLQILSIATGMNPLPNIITGEIFPLRYRSIGASLSVVPDLALAVIVVKTFPGLYDTIGLHGAYSLYAGGLIYSLTVIWFLMPETRGKTLLEIEEEMMGRPVVEGVELTQILNKERVVK